MPNDSVPFVAVVGGFLELNDADSTEPNGWPTRSVLRWRVWASVSWFITPTKLRWIRMSSRATCRVRWKPACTLHPRAVRGEPARATSCLPSKPATLTFLIRSCSQGTNGRAPFYRSLVAMEGVEAVLLMAGADSRLIAGQIAVARASCARHRSFPWFRQSDPD